MVFDPQFVLLNGSPVAPVGDGVSVRRADSLG